METYTANVKCKNCASQNWLHGIPKGQTIDNYLENHPTNCEHCSCLLPNGKPKESDADDEEDSEDE